MQASDSYRERAAQNKRRVKRFKPPNLSKMYRIDVPDLVIPGKLTSYFYPTKTRRDKALKKYPTGKLINPKK